MASCLRITAISPQLHSLQSCTSAMGSLAVAGLTELMPKDQVLPCLSVSFHHLLSEKNCSSAAGQEPDRKASEGAATAFPHHCEFNSNHLWVQSPQSFLQNTNCLPCRLSHNSALLTWLLSEVPDGSASGEFMWIKLTLAGDTRHSQWSTVAEQTNPIEEQVLCILQEIASSHRSFPCFHQVSPAVPLEW